MADAVMEGRAIRSKEDEDEEMMAAPMPEEVSRFIEDDDELEDEVLLGESTLKHLGSSQKPKPKKHQIEEEDEEELELDVEEDEEELDEDSVESDVDED